MKKAKRIFIALLTLSVLFSAFALGAFAAEPLKVDFEYLLEYYEEPTLFYYDFTGEDVDYSSSMMVKRPKSLTAEFVTDDNAPGGKYLSWKVNGATTIANRYNNNNVYFNWNSEDPIDDFIINMTVSGAKNTTKEQNLPRIIISVADVECTDDDAGATFGTTVAAIDYRNQYFSYYKKNVAADGTVSGTETNTSFVVEEGKWYDVSFKYNAELGAATVKITDKADPTKTFTASDAYVPYEGVCNVRVGEHGSDYGVARGSEIKFANIYATGGKYERNPNNRQTVIEESILDMYQAFLAESVDLEDKIVICDIAKKFVDYGFVSDKTEVSDAISALSVGVIGLYNQKLTICNTTYSTLETFAQKKALIEETARFALALKEQDLSGISAELVAQIDKNFELYEEVSADISYWEQTTLEFIKAASAVQSIDFENYASVNEALEGLSAIPYDSTYEGVESADKLFNKLTVTKNDIKTRGDRFIATATIANDDSRDVNERADAYRKLGSEYYYDNVTYPGLSEALDLYNGTLASTIGVVISDAENFIKYVNKADYAVYLSAKQENLDIAATYMSICHPDFSGVADAKTLHAAIQAQVNSKRDSAVAYINAVNALDSLTGSALTDGIKTAQNLQKDGNVLGFDGITDANIKLDKLVASIELREKYCAYFIGLVNSIDQTTGVSELYKLLGLAKEAEQDADQTYTGVSEASAKLTQAISDYNAKVAAINGEFEKASDAAAHTCGIGNTTNIVTGHVIAIIKKFFDED